MLMMALGRPHREAAVGGGGGGDATVAVTHEDDKSNVVNVLHQYTGVVVNDGVVALGITRTPNGAVGTLTSIVIDGITADIIENATNAANDSSIIAVAEGVTGPTVTVNITYSTNNFSSKLVAFSLGNAQKTKTDSGNNSGNPAIFALDIAAGGVAIGIVIDRENSEPALTWTNLTERGQDFYDPVGGYASTWASDAFASSQTNLSIQVASSGATGQGPLLAVASFPKV